MGCFAKGCLSVLVVGFLCLALVGFGYWGPNYARVLNDLPDADLPGRPRDNGGFTKGGRIAGGRSRRVRRAHP